MSDTPLTSTLTPTLILDINTASGRQYVELLSTGSSFAAGPFATIATGAVGSGRLIDVPASTLSRLAFGALVYVQSVNQYFKWSPTFAGAADNITIARPLAVGVGAFIRQTWSQIDWWTIVPAVVIDPVAGNDENIGNAGAPLATNAEWARRYASFDGVSAPPPGTNVSITWNSSTPLNDPWSAYFRLGPNSTLALAGATTIAGSGTLSAFTGPNRVAGAQAMPTVTDAAPQNWAPLVNLHATITNAPRAGTNFVVLANLGGGQATISTPLTANLTTQTSTRQVPAAGDTYQVLNAPTVFVGSVHFELADPSVTTSIVTTTDLVFNFPTTFVTNVKWLAKGIRISSIRTTFVSLNRETDAHFTSSCLFTGGPCLRDGFGCKAQGGASTGFVTLLHGGLPLFDFDFCFFGASAGLASNIGAACSLGTVAFFGTPGGLTLQFNSVVNQQTLSDGTSLIWGVTASGFGATVRGMSGLFYAGGAKPIINSGLGVGREALIGGVDTLWAAVPTAVNVANGAVIAVAA